NCFDYSPGLQRSTEHLEVAITKVVAHINQLDAETAIGFIAAKSANGFAISQPIKRRLDLDIAGGFEDRCEHSLGQPENVVRGHERSFDVDLSEFRLTIGAQIFVTKTFRDLKIFFD